MNVWDQKCTKNPTFSTMYINLYIGKRSANHDYFVGMNYRLDFTYLKSIFPSFFGKEAQFVLIYGIYITI